MPRFVKIGHISDDGVGRIVGALRNPCLDYVSYMRTNHPEEMSEREAAEWRLTYERPDADVALECLAMYQQRIKKDRKRA